MAKIDPTEMRDAWVIVRPLLGRKRRREPP
jgi:hypothetical protein